VGILSDAAAAELHQVQTTGFAHGTQYGEQRNTENEDAENEPGFFRALFFSGYGFADRVKSWWYSPSASNFRWMVSGRSDAAAARTFRSAPRGSPHSR
jgi:hypothetical protein